MLPEANLLVRVSPEIATEITSCWGDQHIVQDGAGVWVRLTADFCENVETANLSERKANHLRRDVLLRDKMITPLGNGGDFYRLFNRVVGSCERRLSKDIKACILDGEVVGVQRDINIVGRQCLSKIRPGSATLLAQRVLNYVSAYNSWRGFLMEKANSCRLSGAQTLPSQSIVERLRGAEIAWKEDKDRLLRNVWVAFGDAFMILCMLNNCTEKVLHPYIEKRSDKTRIEQARAVVACVSERFPDNFSKRVFLEHLVLPRGDENFWGSGQCRGLEFAFDRYCLDLVDVLRDTMEDDVMSVLSVYNTVVSLSRRNRHYALDSDWGAFLRALCGRPIDALRPKNDLRHFRNSLYLHLESIKERLESMVSPVKLIDAPVIGDPSDSDGVGLESLAELVYNGFISIDAMKRIQPKKELFSRYFNAFSALKLAPMFLGDAAFGKLFDDVTAMREVFQRSIKQMLSIQRANIKQFLAMQQEHMAGNLDFELSAQLNTSAAFIREAFQDCRIGRSLDRRIIDEHRQEHLEALDSLFAIGPEVKIG